MQVLVPATIDDTVLTSSTATETDFPAWAAGTSYAAGAKAIRTTTATHRVYQRLIAGTTSTPPEDDPVNWKNFSPTNRWAMFDRNAATRTLIASPLTVVIAMPMAYNDIVLMGVTGTTATVTVTVNGVLARTVAVTAGAVSVTGSTVVITGLAAASGTLQVSLTGTGTVGIAVMAVGTFTSAGDTEGALSTSLLDSSTKGFDAAGNPVVTAGSYATRQEVAVNTPLASFDQLARVLTAVRSTPCIWLGVPSLPGLALYGWPREWTLRRQRGIARGTVQLESLAVG